MELHYDQIEHILSFADENGHVEQRHFKDEKEQYFLKFMNLLEKYLEANPSHGYINNMEARGFFYIDHRAYAFEVGYNVDITRMSYDYLDRHAANKLIGYLVPPLFKLDDLLIFYNIKKTSERNDRVESVPRWFTYPTQHIWISN